MNDSEIKIYEEYGIDHKVLTRSSAASIITMADKQHEEFIENNKVMVVMDNNEIRLVHSDGKRKRWDRQDI